MVKFVKIKKYDTHCLYIKYKYSVESADNWRYEVTPYAIFWSHPHDRRHIEPLALFIPTQMRDAEAGHRDCEAFLIKRQKIVVCSRNPAVERQMVAPIGGGF